MPTFQDMSLGTKELNWAESSELAIAEKWQEMNYAAKRLHVSFEVMVRLLQIRCQDTISED
jgi:hypothetical protein